MEVRENMYAGKCHGCGAVVLPREGRLITNAVTGKKVVSHRPGMCPAAELPTTKASVSQDDLDAATGKVVELMAAKFTDLVPQLVEDNLDRLSRVAEIKIGKAPAVKVDLAHKRLEDVLVCVTAGAAPYLVGPAGSGKTTLAEQVASVLKRKFFMEARVTSEFKLLGFIDAHGNVVRTQFREAYEKGGVFLFDEVDASDADAMTAFNAALANGKCAFPDKLVSRHKDFVAIAAGNTFGRGADRQYVGRHQMDAATLDRFTILEVDYDDDLERQIAGDKDWVKYVQEVRAAIEAEKVRHIVSPRASIMGARLLAAGMERAKVEEAVVWKGLDHSNRSRVVSRMGRA